MKLTKHEKILIASALMESIVGYKKVLRGSLSGDDRAFFEKALEDTNALIKKITEAETDDKD